MNPVTKKKYYTHEEYLALEEKAEYKSEYHDGEIVPLFREIIDGEVVTMAGGSPEHSQVSANIITGLNIALDDSECITHTSDLKIRVEKVNRSFYTDALVVCDELEYFNDSKNIITNPMLIVEVLSPSTADYDKRGKFFYYRQLQSLKEYVLIDPDEPYVDVYTFHEPGKWLLETYTELSQNIKLNSTNTEIPMSHIYKKVNFDKTQKPQDIFKISYG